MGGDRVRRRQDRVLSADASRLDQEAEVDSGMPASVPTDMAAKMKALDRENRELRQANEILRKASVYFAQAELDRRFKA